MAPKKPSASSPILIGNCEVTVEANNFNCKSDPNNLEISVIQKAKVKISVRENLQIKSSNHILCSDYEENGGEGRISASGKHYVFVLVNPKHSDHSSKFYIQEALNIYMKELPAMNYAANTGKKSMFMERCVSNGKYCTLLLKSRSIEGSEVIVAAITYQIVPADTQYAEIPLAAVRSIYQNQGFGRFLYEELRRRLYSVGIRTIFCWGDKESEGFWFKQGFSSIAEVDRKGRARKLPVKADVRRALCFPGGSTLMLSHLNEESSVNPADLLKFHFQLKAHEKSSTSSIYKSVEPGLCGDCDDTLKLLNQTISRTESSPKASFFRENMNLGGEDLNHGSQYPATLEGRECNNMTTNAAKIGADNNPEHGSCSAQGAKRRFWEASLSSLKSKKVKGTYQTDCRLDSKRDLVPECEGKQLKDKSSVEVSATDPLFISCGENNAEECRPIYVTSESLVSKELHSNMQSFRIMLMNIADDTKKAHLTKVIENLGGTITSDGSVSTHVVTGKVRKTLNFCTALCSGAWIVSPSWLRESYREGGFVDESAFLLHDEDYLLKYRIELKRAVLRAKARPRALFKGYDICLATHVDPAVGTLSAIVRCAGGNIIRGLHKVNEASKTIFIASEEETEEALSAAKSGIRTFSSDWLMNSVMRQELDLEASQFAESL